MKLPFLSAQLTKGRTAAIAAGAFVAGWLRDRCFFCPIMQKNRCVTQLRAIESAKQQYGGELGLTNGALVAEEQLLDYISGGLKSLRCPGGGTYRINPLGQAPECSKPDHKL